MFPAEMLMASILTLVYPELVEGYSSSVEYKSVLNAINHEEVHLDHHYFSA